MKITINVAKIDSISFHYTSINRQGYDIEVDIEPWRVKELIFKLWNLFPDEFEECLKEEGIEVKPPSL